MQIDSAYPSNYLKAADLNGQNVKVTISHISMEDVGGDPKPVLYFQGKEKGMVLNKTNANNIKEGYGGETDNWSGKEVVLFEAMVDFQGKTVPSIRIRLPQPKDNAPQQPAPEPAGDNDLDDSIPF